MFRKVHLHRKGRVEVLRDICMRIRRGLHKLGPMLTQSFKGLDDIKRNPEPLHAYLVYFILLIILW